MPGQPLPSVKPAGDLGAGIGGRRWWRELGLCLAGLAGIALFARAVAPEPLRGLSEDVTGARAGPADHAPAQAAGPVLPAPTAVALAAEKTLDADRAAADGAQSGTSGAAPVDAGASDPGSEGSVPVSRTLRLRRGEALVDLLQRAGLSAGEALAAVAAFAPHVDPKRLPAGARFTLTLAQDGGPSAPRARHLQKLVYRSAPDRRVVVSAKADGFSASLEAVPAVVLTGYAAGRITDSLYVDAAREGVPPALIVETIRALGFAVDFERELWPGDRFEILYTTTMAEDGLNAPGEVLFVGLKLRGRRLAYYRFRVDGRSDFFDADGASIRRTLMKTPLDGARLTSRFGRRLHPVLGYVTAHKGVDFGAPPGTPVYAAGDGVIERAGRYGGYGNYIRIRHNGTYETAYAHLSRFARGIHKGVRVRQGEVIGYVGATGRVTGPHLHYEVLVDGRQVNPLTLRLPSGRVLNGRQRAVFDAWCRRVDDMRESLGHAEALRLAAADAGDARGAGQATAGLETAGAPSP